MKTRASLPNQRMGVTLIEVMIVSAIAIVLLGVLWLAVGPSVKRKALEAKVTSDLHQIALAYNMYVTEWDGKFPRGMHSLPKSLPQGLPGDSVNSPLAPHYMGPNTYNLFHSQLDEDDMDRYGSILRWTPEENCVVGAHFIERNTGRKVWRRCYRSDGVFFMYPFDDFTIPCAKIDGSVSWVRVPEDYMDELMVHRASGR